MSEVNDLLSRRKVKDLEDVLAAYSKAGAKFMNAIDGGAGWGSYSEKLLKYLEDPGVVFAFEPFQGNFRFFDSLDRRIILVKKALYHEAAQGRFFVASTVSEDSAWGKRGLAGYSSVGRLVDRHQDKGKGLIYDVLGMLPGRRQNAEQGLTYGVECVAADSEIPPDKRISVVKLDLQGGELDALKGMRRILTQPFFLWVEFTGQPGLIEYIADMGYMLFDTEYVFWGSPSDEGVKTFEVSSEGGIASTGRTLWKGFRRGAWGPDYYTEFMHLKKRLDMVQTDIVCVNREFTDEFSKACDYL